MLKYPSSHCHPGCKMHEILESELSMDVCGTEVLRTKAVGNDMFGAKRGEIIIG